MKNLFRLTFLSLLFFFFHFPSHAQELITGGILLDAETQEPLPGATVRLFQLPDSTQFITTTGDKGLFFFRKLEPSSYLLLVSFVGYKTLEKNIELTENLRLGRMMIEPDNRLLDEVQVLDKIPLAEQKGDTTEYNSRAYKTQPDASAEDLIRKMPGIVVENGQLQAQGEDVSQVLVDGQRFFGNDPTAALRNLPAEIIDKIQVFDQQSDQSEFTGFDDGQSQKTINIVTRKDKNNGEFGKVYGGYGLDDRYQAGGNLNIFKGDRRISLIGQSNNINIQNFSSEDLSGAMGGSSGGGSRRGGAMSGSGGRGRARGRGGSGDGGVDLGNFRTGQQNGINQTHALGLNYNDKIGDKLRINSSYFFNASQNNADQNLSRQTFLSSDSSLFYHESQLSKSQNINHRMNLRLEYQISPKSSLIIQPALSWQGNQGNQSTEGQTLQDDQQMLSSSSNELFTDLQAFNFSNKLLYRQSFEKKGRSLSLRLNTQFSQQEGDNHLMALNTSLSRSGIRTDTLDQSAELVSEKDVLTANMVYTEPLGERWLWQLNGEVSYQKSTAEQLTFQLDENENADLSPDSLLSNDFETFYFSHTAGTGLRYRLGKLNLMGQVKYERAELQNRQFFPGDVQLKRAFHNILPSAVLHYRMGRGKNLRVFYRTSTQAPDVSDLQAVVDNNNPLQLQLGNPDLKQSYQHSLFSRFATTNAEEATVFFWLLGGSYIQNYIGSQTLLTAVDTLLTNTLRLPAGGQLVTPENFERQWTLRSFMSYGVPVTKLKSNLNLNTSVNFSRTPSLINDQSNDSDNTSLGVGVVLSSNFSPLIDFTLSSRSSYNLVRNSIRRELDNNFYNQNSELRFHARTSQSFFVETQVNHQFFSGLDDDFDQNFLLLNASLGYKLFRDQLGEIKFSVFDLLGQNNSLSRTVGEAYVEDLETQVLQRYLMLSFTYQFRNFRL